VLAPFVLFLIIVIWALIDGELYFKEASILGAIWLMSLLGLLFVAGYGIWFVVPITLVDIYLVVKLIGNPKAF